MERIWAPWRITYLTNSTPADTCIFCTAVHSDDIRHNLVLIKRSTCMIMLNRYPYAGGHLMVIPFRHTASLNDLNDSELLDLMSTVRIAQNCIHLAMKPDGYNIGMNCGSTAGAGIADHLHIHIVPRWNGDTGFISVVGDTRVIPEDLDTTYVRLSQALQDLAT